MVGNVVIIRVGIDEYEAKGRMHKEIVLQIFTYPGGKRGFGPENASIVAITESNSRFDKTKH